MASPGPEMVVSEPLESLLLATIEAAVPVAQAPRQRLRRDEQGNPRGILKEMEPETRQACVSPPALV